MILFELRCAEDHVFEAWFRDSAAFDKQAADGSISCPVCGSRDIGKALMAPAVRSKAAVDPARMAAAAAAWRKVQDHIEKNFDHVGPRFAEEARKIHYGEVEQRNIYGQATSQESKELKEEGIKVQQIPWLSRPDG